MIDHHDAFLGASASERQTSSDGSPALPAELRAALRRARIADAEHSGAVYDLRGAELARLQLLDEALAPIYQGLPDGVDLFDHGILPSERPRLYIDIVAFVEMARDGRSYRFMLDSHEGRIALGESTDVSVMKGLVVDHIARRLLAREKALASAAYPTGMMAAAKPYASAPDALSLAMTTPVGAQRPPQRGFFWSGLFLFASGLAAGAALLFAWAKMRGL